MTMERLSSLGLAFTLGACASAAVRADIVSPARAASGATVVALDAAPGRSAPSGKARIQHLARGENAYLGRLSLEPGAQVPEHQDPTEEYIHVLEGSGDITIDGETTRIEPGTTVYMPAGARVRFANGPARLVGLQVFAGPSPASKYDSWTAAEPTR